MDMTAQHSQDEIQAVLDSHAQWLRAEQLETPRESDEWRRIRAAYLAAVAYLEAMGAELK